MKRKSKKKSDYITFSYRNLGIMLAGIILLVITIMISTFNSPQPLHKLTPPVIKAPTDTPIPTISNEPCESTSDSSTWKTYTGLHYSFKYPCGWDDSGGMQPAGGFITLHPCNYQCQTANYIGFSIEQWIYTNLDEYKTAGYTEYKNFSETQDITIDGEPAIKGIIPGITGGGYCCTQLVYYVVHNGKGYHIMYEIPKLNLRTFAQLPAIEPDILSTFQFND